MLAQVSIIIVNWNAGGQLSGLVTSITQYHNDMVSSVIIVDNASTDNSLAQVEVLQDLPCKHQFIRNSENYGFAAACNQGAALASSDYLLFLNPDTRLFEHSLSVPLAFMERPESAAVGIVGIQLVDEHNRIARSCARFPTLGMFLAQALGLNRLPGLLHLDTHLSGWAHDKTEHVDHVIGAFYMMRRSLFETLGGFDERFFVYLEDLDLSLRARKGGWRSFYLAEAQAFHAGGGTSHQVKAHRLFYSLRSRLLYGFKHFPRYKAWSLVLVTFLIEPWSRLILSLLRRSWLDAKHTFQAYGMLICSIGDVLREGLSKDCRGSVTKKDKAVSS